MQPPVVTMLFNFANVSWVVLVASVYGYAAPATTEAVVGSASAMSIDEGRRFWSFRPLARVEPPSLAQAASPIDAFIQASLKGMNLPSARPADKRTLIRRATFDLTGLPPTPQEVEAFVADLSPEGFSRLIDRLLASPHYGERWGRHWLDVARYADSNGMDENVAFGHAWRYRDYVVRAFNDDKPFDQFLLEQLAGDLLPRSEEAITATGFLALGARVLAEPDVQKLEMDIIDEQIDTLGKAFMGMTLGCARCHDHKFDPITQEDYYGLAAIFRSTRSLSAEKMGAVKFWHEHPLATPEQLDEVKKHEEAIKTKKAEVDAFIAKAKSEAKDPLPPPSGDTTGLEAATLAKVDLMRKELKDLEAKRSELPAVMSVTEANIVKTLPVHLGGNYLTLGKPIERGFPEVMRTSVIKPILPVKRSGRLELARWMASSEHPLTARVIVNRVWRWHFGQGIVTSTDNFGPTGSKPSHPELLDWLARTFIENGWSIKELHRLIMRSETYQQASSVAPPTSLEADPRLVDPENRLLWRANIQRLEAEEIRDAMLAASGWLSLEIGGKTIPLRNREYVFDHTSKDASSYESPRRALYLPLIRNHLYDMLEQFDYPDPTMPTGSRNATVVAPQALIMMNAPIVMDSSTRLAALLASLPDDEQRVQHVYGLLYARPPSDHEKADALALIRELSVTENPERAWALLCQTLFAADEFMYLR